MFRMFSMWTHTMRDVHWMRRKELVVWSGQWANFSNNKKWIKGKAHIYYCYRILWTVIANSIIILRYIVLFKRFMLLCCSQHSLGVTHILLTLLPLFFHTSFYTLSRKNNQQSTTFYWPHSVCSLDLDRIVLHSSGIFFPHDCVAWTFYLTLCFLHCAILYYGREE